MKKKRLIGTHTNSYCHVTTDRQTYSHYEGYTVASFYCRHQRDGTKSIICRMLNDFWYGSQVDVVVR